MSKMSAIFGILAAFAVVGCVSSSRFDELFQPVWASDHFIYERELIKMKLDNHSGAGFSSKSKYMFGKVSVDIKLVEGDSAGTVTAFYMSSEGPYHNEFDFEFLGNSTGEPYLVQTNVYVNGMGNREQRLKLWFDPTKDFHSYSILWKPSHVLFLVDEMPVRVFPNLEHKGIPYPRGQTMGVYSSIWHADDWATQGGRIKTNWSHAPFTVSYKGFEINACECPDPVAAIENMKRCGTWDEHHPTVSEVSLRNSDQLMWVRANHIMYDYCSDTARYPTTPEECHHS